MEQKQNHEASFSLMKPEQKLGVGWILVLFVNVLLGSYFSRHCESPVDSSSGWWWPVAGVGDESKCLSVQHHQVMNLTAPQLNINLYLKETR